MQKDLKTPIWLALTAVTLLAGCGTNLVSVEGNVSWDGKPVESGGISFAPADSMGPTVGGEIKDGKYHLSGANGLSPGKKTVTITAVRKTGKQIEAGPPLPPGTMVDDVQNISETKSCEVVDGKVNQHDFELKPPAK